MSHPATHRSRFKLFVAVLLMIEFVVASRRVARLLNTRSASNPATRRTQNGTDVLIRKYGIKRPLFGPLRVRPHERRLRRPHRGDAHRGPPQRERQVRFPRGSDLRRRGHAPERPHHRFPPGAGAHLEQLQPPRPVRARHLNHSPRRDCP